MKKNQKCNKNAIEVHSDFIKQTGKPQYHPKIDVQQ